MISKRLITFGLCAFFLAGSVQAGAVIGIGPGPSESPGIPPDPDAEILGGLTLETVEAVVVADPVNVLSFHIYLAAGAGLEPGTSQVTLYDIGHLTADPFVLGLYGGNILIPAGTPWIPNVGTITGGNLYEGQQFLGPGLSPGPTPLDQGKPPGPVPNPITDFDAYANYLMPLNITFIYQGTDIYWNTTSLPIDFGLFTILTDYPSATPPPATVSYYQESLPPPGTTVPGASIQTTTVKDVANTPEPATWLLAFLGGLPVVAHTLRKRRLIGTTINAA